MTKEAIEALLKTLDVWLIIFGVFVAIGVVGESIVGFVHFRRGNELQQIQSSENLAQQREIERLRGLTESSQERIAEAQREAAQANALAKQYEGGIAESNARAKNAEAQVALAKEQAAKAELGTTQARLELAKIQERMADRTLSVAQQDALTSHLTSFHDVVVDVVVWGDTPEIQTISGLILDSMARAGWKIQRGQAVGGGAVVRGILIATRTGADAATIRASNALISALQSVGLSAGPWPFEKLQTPVAMMNSGFKGDAPIRLFIGSKP